MRWDRLVGQLVDVTGWTFEYVEELSLPQVRDLFAYWEVVPPAAVSLARIENLLSSMFTERKEPASGVRPAPTSGTEQGDLSDLVAMFPSGSIR